LTIIDGSLRAAGGRGLVRCSDQHALNFSSDRGNLVNVVKIDPMQDVAPSRAKTKKPPSRKQTPVSERKPRSAKAISAPRHSSRPPPTSVRLHEDELKAVKALAAAQGARSASDVIQRAVRDYVSGKGGFEAPTSLGVVEGVYGTKINDDVVELANQLRMLEFALLRAADLLPPCEETSELRRLLEDASRTLTRIAGSVAYRRKPIGGAEG
jgi:Ribbon-helix-helix protein, copG family